MKRDLQSAVDLTILHKVTSCDAFFVFVCMVVCIDILGQIELDVSQSDALSFTGTGIFLYDLEMYKQLLQHLILANDKAYRGLFLIVEDDLVVLDVAFVCAAAMFGSAR